jgi:hypothetical protein
MSRARMSLLMGLVRATAACGGQIDSDVAPAAAETLAAPIIGDDGHSGAHFQLDIIGVPKGKTATMTNNDRQRILVPLAGATKIMLSDGDFAVLDANGTDGSSSFQLPDPDPDGDGVTQYSVFARALSTPGGSSTATACASDPVTGELYCSVHNMVLTRSSGRSRSNDVSNELLFVTADPDGDGALQRVNLFGGALTNFFWQYDNNGLKLAQLRFYQIATNVN